ncbi:MAG: adenylate/guanylate cyclase domain-containing protein [Pseudomonadota bacterium]
MNATQSSVERKLTTILAADAAGYSSAMNSDELATLEALRAARSVFSRFIERHNGRIANTAGDGLIADFPSVVEAVQCAIEVQRELGRDGDGGLGFRIGIHLGDVIVDGEDLLGEGVNLAARLQAMAEPGGVLVSRQVYDQVHSKLTVGFEYLGEQRPKNYSEDIPVYGVAFGNEGETAIFGRKAAGKTRRTVTATSSGDVHKQSPSAPKKSSGRQTLRERVIRHASLLGTIWVVLLIINIATSGIFWAKWPGLAMLAVLGLEAAPLFAAGRYSVQMIRLSVIAVMLLLINLFTWSGTFWAMWPIGAIVAVEVIRRVAARA